MTTQHDSAITLKKESSFGTPVTVDSSYPFTDTDLEYKPTFAQGVSPYGARVVSAAARVLVKSEVGGSFTTEGKTKGLGKLFEAALGVGVSNNIADTSYQQLFTPLVDDYLPSYTIQLGVPLIGGTTSPMTFAGMVCGGFELTADNAAIPMIKWNWVGKSMATDTAFVTPAYPATSIPFSFVGGTIQSGTVTVPTTTALGSGNSTLANIRSINVNYDNGLDTEGFNFGASGTRSRKPVVELRSITGTLVAEYDSNTLRDAFVNQTDVAIILKFATTTAISGSNYPTLQIVIPVTRLEGETPKPANGGPITQSLTFTGLDGGVASHPIYVAIVTAETAI
jgi:hypothetical protein